MSQIRETRLFDIFVVVLFVAVVGWFAVRSSSPQTSSIPGVNWPQQSQLIQESNPILEGDPLPPGDGALPMAGETPELAPVPGEAMPPQGTGEESATDSWE